ncbi:MAG: translation initiation factor IF-2 [Clostridia bacterium]|nr:translation initiation factor IF-2 [Clostridia bacterium]
MITSPNSRISNMAKDFGVKSKTIIDILEARGIAGKKNTATLSADEYGLVVEALTRDNQITNMTQYLAGEADIPREKKEAPKAEAPKAEAPKAEAPKAEAPKAEAPKAEAPKAEAPKAEAPKAEAPKAEAPKQPVQFRPNTNQRGDRPQGDRNNNGQRGDRPQGDRNNNGQRGDRPQGDRNNNGQRFGDRPQGDRNNNNGQRFGDRPQGDRNNNNGQRFGDRPQGDRGNNGQRFGDRPQNGGARPFSKDDDQPRNNFRPAAPKPAQPQATSYSKPTATGGSTRVIDTRGAEGNVDLSKYDEKLDTLVPDAAKDFSGAKQKLKKQNNQQQFGKKKRGDKEREAMDKMRRDAAEKAKKQPLNVTIPEELQVNELAALLHVTNAEIVKKLMLLGIMASVNQVIDFDTAALIADEFGAKVTKEVVVTIEERLFEETEDAEEDLVARAPVVCVMGHVDHGKTSLLDAIRNTNVTAGEAGGITQAIGAYCVCINDRDITFLDTPGHEAFTAMRARGAKSTDIAILVVAADDGIMPQTVEAINHAKAADIPIIVAINKMDKPHANPDMVKQSLTNYELVPEEWGGDTICVPVSALTHKGIDELLEMVLLVADMKELKANPNRRAKGLVLESRLDKGRGPVASVLVQTGTLRAGDVLIAGTAVGRVRAMINDKGRTIKEAGPSVPVEITGLAEIPQAGDEFAVVSDERMARELAEQRRDRMKEEAFKATARANLDTLFAQIKEGVKDLNIIIKADVAGSVEAVRASLVKLSNDEVKVNVNHTAVGGITENDVMLAAASNAIIIGFAVRPDKNALDSAEAQGVEIRTYRIIYECIEEIEAAMKGMLAPEFREALLGHAEVRQTIRVPNVGTIAGSYITDGKVTRQSKIRIVRDGIVIFEDSIASLKRFKDDAKEVVQGYECGIGLERFNDIKEGDILEAFIMEEVKRG